MPKRGNDILACEIGRFFKLHAKGMVEVLSFTVPRKVINSFPFLTALSRLTNSHSYSL